MEPGSPRPARTFRLVPHPDTPCPSARSLAVDLGTGPDGALHLLYRLEGDVDALALPPPGPARREDRLWEHTCFEAFLGRRDASAYREYNASPSGAWAAYDFTATRTGMAPARGEAPSLGVETRPGGLALACRLPPPDQGPWTRIALSAVLEGRDGSRSFWALAHAPGPPDFHHPLAFVDLAPAP